MSSNNTVNLVPNWELEHELSTRSYYEFFKLAWVIIEPGVTLRDNWHLKYLADRLQQEVERISKGIHKKKDLIINIPPGSSKSSLVTILFPVWAWIVNPKLRFITASYAGSLATSHAQKSRNVIDSDWFQDLFGDRFIMKHDLNRTSEYENDHTGIRIASSVGGAVTGRHADIVIVDDPLNPKAAASEVSIDKTNKWWDTTISTRLREPQVSLKIILAQRLHEKDLPGYCLETKRGQYEHICLPGELTEDVRPKELRLHYQDGILNPKRHNRIVLDKLKMDLGSYGYAGQILQNPIPAEGNLIKKAWFGRFTMQGLRQKVKDKKDELTWNYTLDGAYTKDQQNDPSAMLCYATYEGDMYIRAVKSVWKEFPELVKFISEFVVRHGYSDYSRIYIEPKATGLSAAQTMRKETELNIIIDKAPRIDKIARVKSVSAFLEGGRCFLLEDTSWIDAFLNQLAAFPNGRHDDEVDCLSMAINNMISNPNKILDVGVF